MRFVVGPTLPFEVWRPLVRSLLETCDRESYEAFDESWSLQGFGMFRKYITPDIRLHVWSPLHKVPNVSTIHDHPWSFTSYVLAGEIVDHRFYETNGSYGVPMMRQRIKCGPGGGPCGEPQEVRLGDERPRTFRAGDVYQMSWSDLHATEASPGAVTLIVRRSQPDPDHARVYYPCGGQWVSAEPRPARHHEISEAMDLALAAMEVSCTT